MHTSCPPQRRKPAMLTRRHLLAASTAGLLSPGMSFVPRAFAQAIKKPAHVIVGFPAGGGTDVIARILADGLRGPYAPTVLVENKPGAAARIAVEYVKNAEPDGSVMLFTPDFPITVYPHSFRSLSYDPLRDFTAVSPAAKSMLANAAGVAMTPVHYRGGAPALQDLLGGHVPASVNPISESLPLAKSGTLRILAVTGSRRSSFLPDVPTMTEAGYNVVVESWLGVFVPAKTPTDIVEALGAAIAEAAKSSNMIENLAKVGNTTAFHTPAQFAATVKADLARWAPIVKASGFVAED